MGKNAYFQVEITDGQVILNFYPAQDGGEELKTNEVANYLSLKNLPYDLVALDNAIKGPNGKIKLCDGSPIIESESISVTVAEDKMTAYARFYPPFKDGTIKNEADIISDLKLYGVKFGTNKEEIAAFIANREYCKTYVVANGMPITEGKDAVIHYNFKTDLTGRPAQNEDGSVDYHNLDNICRVSAGDVLATMEPAVNGRAGMNVLGEILKARDVKRLKLQHGNNITVSEDGLTMTSEIDGLVNLVEDKVFVSNILEVNDVDASTGDINFNGGVLVRGDVKTGYKVIANGDIEVKGAVENAYVESTAGQVIVARGINGMAQGTLKASGNILCKYIQNAKVFAGGYVESDCIINSEVVASTRVCVQGKKGFITGGVVRAGTEIEVKTLGSEMGSDTTVEVGTDPAMRDRYNRLKKEIAEYSKSVAQNEPLAVALITKIKSGARTSPEQLKQAQVLAKMVSEQKEAIANNTKEMGLLEIELDKESDAVLRVTGVAYPGANILISGATLMLKTEYHYCRFKKEGADVRMVAI